MFDWIIEQRNGKWCVIQTYVSYQEDNYYESVLFESESQLDAVEWRSRNTAYLY